LVFDGKGQSLRKSVIIRADSSDKIGLGHVMRCFSLAQMIKGEFEASFCAKEIPNDLAKEISSAGFNVVKIQREDEFIDRLNSDSIVILDGYDFGSEYQSQIKGKQAKICWLSDFASRNPFADIILNQAPGVNSSDYQTSFSSRFLLGADYALLRPIFFQSFNKPKISNSVFICFGGADPQNLSHKTLEVLANFTAFNKITLVTGAGFQFRPTIDEFIENSNQQIDYHHSVNAEKMCELMSESELAIVPSSSIIYEVMATNCQIISGYYMDNQKLFYDGLKAQNCFYDAGQFESENLIAALHLFLQKPLAKKNIIDKKSPQRISKAFSQLAMLADIHLEEMKLGDLALTYNWASNPEVRKYSFQQNSIKLAEHAEWFVRKLANENVLYFKAFYKKKVIGSVRFDIENEFAIISYLLDPKTHGSGLALPMLMSALEMLTQKWSKHSKVIGYVMKGNLASIRIFEALGFERKDENDRFQFFKCSF